MTLWNTEVKCSWIICIGFLNCWVVSYEYINYRFRHCYCKQAAPALPYSFAFKGFVFQNCQDMELFRANLVYIIFVEYFESEIISSSSPRCFQIKTGKFLCSLQHVWVTLWSVGRICVYTAMETVFVLCTVEPRTVKGPLIPAQTVAAYSPPKIDSEHPAHSLSLWKKSCMASYQGAARLWSSRIFSVALVTDKVVGFSQQVWCMELS